MMVSKKENNILAIKLFHKIFIARQIMNNKQAIQKALIFIKESYNHKLTLKEVSEKVGLSPYYFSHLFKEEVGVSFITYLNKL